MAVSKSTSVAQRSTLWRIFHGAGVVRTGNVGNVGSSNSAQGPDEEEGLESDGLGSSSTVSMRYSLHPGAVANGINRRMEHIQLEITAIGTEIATVEGIIVEVQHAVQHSTPYRGKQGSTLQAEEVRLARKVEQLREEKKQVRDEMLLLLNAVLRPDNGGGRVARQMSVLMTPMDPGDSRGIANESQRHSVLSEGQATPVSGSAQASTRVEGNSVGALYGILRSEEDSRLTTRLDSFANPIVVSTLVAGFCLVLVEITSVHVAQQLASLSFALEMAATFILSSIAFHGQQLYSHSRVEWPRTRPFLQKMRPITASALVCSVAGMAAFVVAFLLEASAILGDTWMTLVTVVFCPSIFASIMLVHTVVMAMRRHSIESMRRSTPAE